ncbi:MAG: hypothetical protein JL55_32305 [Pseudomonas sp. BICA1-14]|nr:MAG: hypothetical protein JL55_32305 [[Pseudomonas] sp. BICA1-14]
MEGEDSTVFGTAYQSVAEAESNEEARAIAMYGGNHGERRSGQERRSGCRTDSMYQRAIEPFIRGSRSQKMLDG